MRSAVLIAASAAKFCKRDISSASESAFPGFLAKFLFVQLPPKRGVLVQKNSLASYQRCSHSVAPRALTCPFKQSNLSAWLKTKLRFVRFLGFGAKFQSITRTRLEYIVIHICLECFPAKENRPPSGPTAFYKSVCEKHSEDSGVGSKWRPKVKDRRA